MSEQLVFTAIRYGIAILALFVTLLAMHRWLPNRPHRTRELLPGVLLTIVLFVVAGTAFSLYLAHFADYSLTYGSMASIVIALMFFYMTSAIVVLGAYVNAAVSPREFSPPPAPHSPSSTGASGSLSTAANRAKIIAE